MSEENAFYNAVEKPAETPQQAIKRLAGLTFIDYAVCKKEEAKKLNITASDIDKAVKIERGGNDNKEELVIVEELTACDKSVNGSDLLNEMVSLLNRHAYLPDGAADAVAAWCLGTYCMDSWRLYPKCLITSPERRCGKTNLIEIMEGLTYKSLVASSITASSLFRCIDKWQPTLFLDEADTFLKDNAELNGVINAGHKKRTATVIRSEKNAEGEYTPTAFSVWTPQVIAGIGSQRDTLVDRSIHVEMVRKLPDEIIHKIPVDFFEVCKPVRQQCLTWAQDNINALKQSCPTIPNYNNDRAQDNWQPLAAIASVAGGDWLDKILGAYKALEGAAAIQENAGILLLQDIQTIFKARNCSKIFTGELVERLIAIEESPWGEWRRGYPMTQNSLSRLLKPFKIYSKQMRMHEKKQRGFELKQFENTFSRYLSLIPPIQSGTTVQASCGAGYSHFQSGTQEEVVPLAKPLKPSCDTACTSVPLEKGGV